MTDTPTLGGVVEQVSPDVAALVARLRDCRPNQMCTVAREAADALTTSESARLDAVRERDEARAEVARESDRTLREMAHAAETLEHAESAAAALIQARARIAEMEAALTRWQTVIADARAKGGFFPSDMLEWLRAAMAQALSPSRREGGNG